MGFSKLSEIIEESNHTNEPFWKVILYNDCRERNVTEEESIQYMKKLLWVMQSADENYDADLRSPSNMAGGDGAKLEMFRKKENRLIGDFLTMVMEKAVKMGESNACMKRIVAMPTAGSCGVIPAVLLSYKEYKQVPEEEIIKALYVAGGIGEVIAASASISGAEGGCQAEIGTASAMAAGALTFLEGGDNSQIVHGVALAIKNMLGLTCDPVAGLVEVPCIKRNISGAVNAVIASQMAIAGIQSAIAPDETIDAMQRIGKQIPVCLKETGLEGLATTQTALELNKRLTK